MSYFNLRAPTIVPADIGHPTRDDIIADLQDRLRFAAAEIERLADQVVTLRAEVRRLTTAPGLPPVGWLLEQQGAGR